MKNILFLILVPWMACQSHTQPLPDQVPYHRDPETPDLETLESIGAIPADSLTDEQYFGEDRRGVRRYFLLGEPYSGWSEQVFPDNGHRIRFVKYDDGYPVWQIGYWDNGALDHDFHLMDTQNLGSQRMWNRDGSPYIDYFYSSPGNMDGLQRRWHGNGQLARKGLWEDGTMLEEVLYDEEGTIIEP